MQKNAVEADDYMVHIFTCSLFNIIICKYEVRLSTVVIRLAIFRFGL